VDAHVVKAAAELRLEVLAQSRRQGLSARTKSIAYERWNASAF
jgi:hypothetical protein